MQHLHLESASAGSDCAVLRVAGEIDVYTAPELREKLIALLDKGALHVILDLREVEFLDSTGLGTLVGALKRQRWRDGSLRLVIGSDQIIRIFRITGLVEVFPIHPTVPQSIASDDHWWEILGTGGHDVDTWCRDHGLL